MPASPGRYRVSFHKVFLLASTGLCSIYAWGFNAFGEAFFIMNLFHAVQYLGLVWWSEGKRVRKLLRLEALGVGALVAGVVSLGLVLAYGAFAELQDLTRARCGASRRSSRSCTSGTTASSGRSPESRSEGRAG